MFCSEPRRLSRPNAVTNHGTPAAGKETVCSVSVDGVAACARHAGRDCTFEIAMRICGAKPLPRLRPFGGNLAAPNDLARFHFEDIGKVASNSNLELKPYRLHAVVGDIEIL